MSALTDLASSSLKDGLRSFTKATGMSAAKYAALMRTVADEVVTAAKPEPPEGEGCGMKWERQPDDMNSGHVEYEPMTMCGEYTCSDECWESWAFCPHCGKPFVQPTAKEGE